MAGVMVDNYLGFLNGFMATGMTGNNAEIGLFANNHTPGLTDDISVYTEATFPGYARFPLSGGLDFGVIAHVDTFGFNPATFIRASGAGSQSIYGYFVIDTTFNFLIWAEKFGAPIVVATVGQTIVVVPLTTTQDPSV